VDPEVRGAKDLSEQARSIPFFALAKHLLRLLPTPASIGRLGPVAEETVRFVHDIAPIFHPSDVAALRWLRKGGRDIAEVRTTFVGLVGAVSPLANYFTEKLLGEELSDSHSVRDFYDVFHHRLVSLVYRVHLRATPLAEVRLDGEDGVSRRSIAATGMAGDARGALSRRDWLGAARLIGRRPRTRAALEGAIRLALPHLTFEITDFLRADSARARREGPRMSKHMLVRRHRQDTEPNYGQHADRVRLVVGPVGAAGLQSLLPSGSDFERLRAAVRATLGGRLDAELEIEIACGEEPRPRMTRDGPWVSRDTVVLRDGASRSVRVRLPLMDDVGDVRPVYLVSRPST
jgi:type VI secretion system protein ImpH